MQFHGAEDEIASKDRPPERKVVFKKLLVVLLLFDVS